MSGETPIAQQQQQAPEAKKVNNGIFNDFVVEKNQLTVGVSKRRPNKLALASASKLNIQKQAKLGATKSVQSPQQKALKINVNQGLSEKEILASKVVLPLKQGNHLDDNVVDSEPPENETPRKIILQKLLQKKLVTGAQIPSQIGGIHSNGVALSELSPTHLSNNAPQQKQGEIARIRGRIDYSHNTIDRELFHQYLIHPDASFQGNEKDKDKTNWEIAQAVETRTKNQQRLTQRHEQLRAALQNLSSFGVVSGFENDTRQWFQHSDVNDKIKTKPIATAPLARNQETIADADVILDDFGFESDATKQSSSDDQSHLVSHVVRSWKIAQTEEKRTRNQQRLTQRHEQPSPVLQNLRSNLGKVSGYKKGIINDEIKTKPIATAPLPRNQGTIADADVILSGFGFESDATKQFSSNDPSYLKYPKPVSHVVRSWEIAQAEEKRTKNQQRLTQSHEQLSPVLQNLRSNLGKVSGYKKGIEQQLFSDINDEIKTKSIATAPFARNQETIADTDVILSGFGFESDATKQSSSDDQSHLHLQDPKLVSHVVRSWKIAQAEERRTKNQQHLTQIHEQLSPALQNLRASLGKVSGYKKKGIEQQLFSDINDEIKTKPIGTAPLVDADVISSGFSFESDPSLLQDPKLVSHVVRSWKIAQAEERRTKNQQRLTQRHEQLSSVLQNLRSNLGKVSGYKKRIEQQLFRHHSDINDEIKTKSIATAPFARNQETIADADVILSGFGFESDATKQSSSDDQSHLHLQDPKLVSHVVRSWEIAHAEEKRTRNQQRLTQRHEQLSPVLQNLRSNLGKVSGYKKGIERQLFRRHSSDNNEEIKTKPNATAPLTRNQGTIADADVFLSGFGFESDATKQFSSDDPSLLQDPKLVS